jgi:polar amino acid transport system substrate-binding protein
MKVRSSVVWTAVVVALAIGMVGVAFAGKLQQQLTQESVVEDIVKRGVLRVGMSTFVPWAMKDKTGKWVGYEIDVARRLADDMGVKVEFVPTKWSGIIPALLTGKFDVIIGSMGIRPARNLKVNFSIPYEYSGMSMAASKKLAAGFDSLEDFNRSDVTVAARLGSTAAEACKKFFPKAQHRLFDDNSQAWQEVLNDRVHAAVGSAPMPLFQTLKYPDKLFMPVKKNFTKEPIGFAVRKGDYDSLNFFNSWIRIVDNAGWLAERQHYWFETRDWANLIE